MSAYRPTRKMAKLGPSRWTPAASRLALTRRLQSMNHDLDGRRGNSRTTPSRLRSLKLHNRQSRTYPQRQANRRHDLSHDGDLAQGGTQPRSISSTTSWSTPWPTVPNPPPRLGIHGTGSAGSNAPRTRTLGTQSTRCRVPFYSGTSVSNGYRYPRTSTVRSPGNSGLTRGRPALPFFAQGLDRQRRRAKHSTRPTIGNKRITRHQDLYKETY